MEPGTITVNGEPAARSADTVAGVVGRLGYDVARPGIAIALNGRVVPRSRWADERVSDGDAIEVVSAVQGG
jgi:sulfur carrier protein